MMRKVRKREELIADVVETWNNLPREVNRADMMIKCPDFYFAVAWLAAHETVTKELKERK